MDKGVNGLRGAICGPRPPQLLRVALTPAAAEQIDNAHDNVLYHVHYWV